MKLIASLTLSCLILTTQAQNLYSPVQYYPAYQNPDTIAFPDKTNAGTSQPNQNDLTQIFGNPSRTNNGVEIEKSNEILFSTTVDQAGVPSSRPVTSEIQRNAQRQPGTPNRQAAQADTTQQASIQSTASKPAGYNSHLYAVTNIGIGLLRNINAVNSGNVVLSPYSITSLLALLQQGAVGQTQEEIYKLLGMTPSMSAAAYSAISTDYKNRNSRNILRTANNVFVGDTFNINPNFKRVAQNQFDSDITPVLFSRPEQAARQINNWVASKTNNKIERLVSPDSIDSTTQLVLVNAVYFKGLWEVPFNPRASYNGEFHFSYGQSTPKQFMRMKRPIKHGVDSATSAQVVVLPFEGNQYSMMIILPARLGVSGTLASLTSDRLLSYLTFPLVDTQLEIPKFTVRADTNLEAVLKKMGLSRMFGPYAELDGLGSYRSSTPQISSAVHSAVLSVDENGATAAAATSFAAVALSYEEPAMLFKADRPFIVVLWDTVTSLPLFMAKIEDPLQ